jgi:hypothetical protein
MAISCSIQLIPRSIPGACFGHVLGRHGGIAMGPGGEHFSRLLKVSWTMVPLNHHGPWLKTKTKHIWLHDFFLAAHHFLTKNGVFHPRNMGFEYHKWGCN